MFWYSLLNAFILAEITEFILANWKHLKIIIELTTCCVELDRRLKILWRFWIRQVFHAETNEDLLLFCNTMVNGDDVCLHCTIIYRKSRQHDIHPYIVFELFNRKQVNCIQWYFQRFKKNVESLFGKDGQKLASMTSKVCYDTHFLPRKLFTSLDDTKTCIIFTSDKVLL